MLPKKHLLGSEKRKKKTQNEVLIKSQQGALSKSVFKKVDTQANLGNNDNKNLDHENENEEIDDNSSVPNDVPNTNIKNIGDDYEQEIPHFDIYDTRN
ncbi:hypothetical protein MTR_6g009140 [Medicago truncatula]|uniref:Uncharacterized protein n=1 Tax=Medicago truncatula TaxID=3880 RepID=G7KJY6_MEDTR|nr:hypothetical protein MTR_6g009140 [Medicago truncatula]